METGARHEEHHFRASATVRDVVIGMSDGLTVPFALAAGISGAVSTVHVVVIAGLAEIAAGSIAMGLGGYLAARTDAEHYLIEREREREEIDDHPDEEADEVVDILRGYGVAPQVASGVADHLRRNPRAWLDFLMRFELGMTEPEPGRARASAGTIAASYVAGGLVPLSPYIFISRIGLALRLSVAVTLVALFAFGYIKGLVSGTRALRGAIQTTVTGGLAASAAFLLARLIGR